MPEQLYNLFFTIFPLTTAGISFFSKSFYETEIVELEELKNYYVALLDAVATHKTCKSCKKDKKSACKHGKNQKEEILKAIDNTVKKLTRIKDKSLKFGFLCSGIAVIYVVLWVIFSYKENNSLTPFFEGYYYTIFLPLAVLVLFYLYFKCYKIIRKYNIKKRCKKHYCNDIIKLVEIEQETLSSVKMENI